jgi:uncharacterized membrane protein YfcA
MNTKDKLSNWAAILIVVIGAITTYLQSSDLSNVNWGQVALIGLSAVIAYLTGKPTDLKK